MNDLPNWIKWDKDKGKYVLVKEVRQLKKLYIFNSLV